MTNKALVVSPYLDHLGGGERYMLSAASALESLGYQVYFSWDNLEEITKLSTILGITLKAPMLDPLVKQLYFGKSPIAMFQSTRGYNIVFYLSDGSIPLLGGRRNILHMQVPFHDVGGRSLKNGFKKLCIHDIVVNSHFTKAVVDKEYGVNSKVLYPPVDMIKGEGTKQKQILSVGRFEPSLNTKHQDVLIEGFRLLSSKVSGWKLVLAGGSSSDVWLNTLKEKAAGLDVTFAANVSHDELTHLYQTSTLYWHAAGYGVDEHKNPELTEHFGISTVEAISALCIPLVVPYGGQKEIVKDERCHWQTLQELVTKSIDIIDSLSQDSHDLKVDLSTYSVDHFISTLKQILL